MRFSGFFFVLIAVALAWFASEIQPSLDFTLDEIDEQVAFSMLLASFGCLLIGFGMLCSRNPDHA